MKIPVWKISNLNTVNIFCNDLYMLDKNLFRNYMRVSMLWLFSNRFPSTQHRILSTQFVSQPPYSWSPFLACSLLQFREEPGIYPWFPSAVAQMTCLGSFHQELPSGLYSKLSQFFFSKHSLSLLHCPILTGISHRLTFHMHQQPLGYQCHPEVDLTELVADIGLMVFRLGQFKSWPPYPDSTCFYLLFSRPGLTAEPVG